MAMEDVLKSLQDFDVNDLDLDNVGSWPAAVKVIVYMIALVAVLVLGYMYHVKSLQEELERQQARETELRDEFEKKAFQAANLEAYRKQMREMEESFGALVSQLPSDTEVPGLLEDITLTALDNELTIESIDLRAENRTEFYVELPIDIVVEGDYHKIGTFVSGVANLSRIVTLHDFAITPQSSNQDLKMRILAKTYRYLDEEG